MLLSLVVLLSLCSRVVSDGVGLKGSTIVDSSVALLTATSVISRQGNVGQQCAVGIDNRSNHTLTSPMEFTAQGVVGSIPDDEIAKNGSTVVKFHNKLSRWIWAGSSGVITYQLGRQSGDHLAIIWNVPWGHFGITNSFNIWLTDESASKKLYDELYERGLTDTWNSVGRIVKKGGNCDIEATMTNNNRAALVAKISGC